MSEIKIRVADAPVGGARIAWSYLATVVGLLVAGLLWTAWTPFGGAVCSDAEDIVCLLGWNSAGALVGAVVGLSLGGFVFRLGWEWWAVLAGLVLGMPLWFDTVPEWASILVLILAPALAAAATWTGPRRPAWRPWAIGATAVLLVVLGALSILV